MVAVEYIETSDHGILVLQIQETLDLVIIQVNLEWEASVRHQDLEDLHQAFTEVLRHPAHLDPGTRVLNGFQGTVGLQVVNQAHLGDMVLPGIFPHQEVDTDHRPSGIQAHRADDTALLTRTEDQCQLDTGIEMDLLHAGSNTDPTRMILTKTEDALMKKRDSSFGTADLQRDADL